MGVHGPVLLQAAVDGLLGDINGLYIDVTFGRGGHSQALLARLGPKARLLAFDRDPQAAEAATQIKDPRFKFVRRPFSQMSSVLAELAIDKVDGILADLGVSSPQLDQAIRGFSFMKDGPLDMRMDSDHGPTVAEWLHRAEVSEIAQVLREYGEERYAGPIARAIVARQQAADAGQASPLARTVDLAELVRQTLARAGAPRESQHPATRTFQALRIFINRELDELDALLEQAPRLLRAGGKLGIISFHSLEDRRVKQAFQRLSRPSTIPRPRGMGRSSYGLLASEGQTSGLPAVFSRISRIRPSAQEVTFNSRARSAVLRIAERSQA